MSIGSELLGSTFGLIEGLFAFVLAIVVIFMIGSLLGRLLKSGYESTKGSLYSHTGDHEYNPNYQRLTKNYNLSDVNNWFNWLDIKHIFNIAEYCFIEHNYNVKYPIPDYELNICVPSFTKRYLSNITSYKYYDESLYVPTDLSDESSESSESSEDLSDSSESSSDSSKDPEQLPVPINDPDIGDLTQSVVLE
jgi:hypothetical protein